MQHCNHLDVLGFDPLAWDAATWGALAAWVTVAIYVILATYAVKQVREARQLREQQVRPFVVVHFHVDWITELIIENVGTTLAYDVQLSFDPPLTSTMSKPWAWEESTLFTAGIPTLPPNKRIRVFFDSINARLASSLPLTYEAVVAYRGTGKQRFSETHILDLELYKGTSPPPKGMPHLVDAVAELQKELEKWTDVGGGLLVNAVDREQASRRQVRPFRIKTALTVRRNDGNIRFVEHLVERALRRRGWIQ